MDPGRDQQEFNRLRREAIRRWTRQGIKDCREIKRRKNKVKTKPDGWEKGWLLQTEANRAYQKGLQGWLLSERQQQDLMGLMKDE